MDVKKGSVTTKSLENPNQRPETKPLKSKLSVVSRKVIAKTTKVKKGLKELGKKGCKVFKELLEPKNTAKEVSKHPRLILMSTIMSHNQYIMGLLFYSKFFVYHCIREPMMYCKLCLKINF